MYKSCDTNSYNIRGKRVGSMIACQTNKQKALISAEQLSGSIENIDKIINCVTRLCHEVRPIVQIMI